MAKGLKECNTVRVRINSQITRLGPPVTRPAQHYPLYIRCKSASPFMHARKTSSNKGTSLVSFGKWSLLAKFAENGTCES